MRHTPEERQTHVELWRGSGLTKAAYCRQAEIPYHCLVSWCRAREAVEERDSASGFVRLDGPVLGDGVRPGAHLLMSDGSRLALDESVDPGWAARLIAAVRAC